MPKQTQHAYTRPDLDALVAAKTRKGKLRVLGFATDAGRAATTHLSGVLLHMECDCGQRQSMKWGAFHRAKPAALACTDCKRAAWGKVPTKSPELAKGKGEMQRTTTAYAAMPDDERKRVSAIVNAHVRALRASRMPFDPASAQSQRVLIEAVSSVQNGEDENGSRDATIYAARSYTYLYGAPVEAA